MTAYSEQNNIEVHLDYACELYEFKQNQKAIIALARSLDTGVSGSADGAREAKREMWRGGEQGLAQDYDYVMYGKVSWFRVCMSLEDWRGCTQRLSDFGGCPSDNAPNLPVETGNSRSVLHGGRET